MPPLWLPNSSTCVLSLPAFVVKSILHASKEIKANAVQAHHRRSRAVYALSGNVRENGRS
jgi:hypothetical protein